MIEIEPPPSFQAQVWKRLSAIDCSARVDKKQNLTYLSWAWAWGILMENYPASTYSFDDPFIFPDGTGEIWVEVTVREGENAWTQKMWLPMLNFKNAPVTNPNAAQINYTRMRVLTKCLAMFGLGHYIYAGEDLPSGADPVTQQQDGPVTKAFDRKSLAGLDIEDPDFPMREMAIRGALAKFNTEEIDIKEAKALIDDAVRGRDHKETNEIKLAIWKRFDASERNALQTISGVQQT